MDKATLRTTAKATRQTLAEGWNGASAQKLEAHLMQAIHAHAPKIVGMYMPIQDECPLGNLPYQLAQEGVQLALPVVLDLEKPMIFRQWQVDAPVTGGVFGIGVPGQDCPECLPDVMLVPLLAYDARGFRLGYGKGCYDRTIPLLRQQKPVVAIGVAYDGQRLDRVPTDVHDVPLDQVATPAGIERFSLS
jgi:5-formyltetrahydrofolate cyclo-ligase